MQINSKVIIIGGGIAGPSLALFLKKIGIESEVYESNDKSSSIGAGLNIAANGINVLAELGLADKAIRNGSIVKDGVIKNAKARRLAKFRFTNTEKYKYPCVNIKRETLRKIIVEELRSKEIPLHYNKRLENIIQDENGVTAIFEDGTQAKGTILIGADGVGSRVRKYVLSNVINPGFTGIIGCGGFVSKTKIPGLLQSELDNLNFIYGKNGFFGFSAVNNNEIMWWTNIMSAAPYSKEELTNINPGEERVSLLKQYGNYSFPIPEIIKQSESFVRVNVFDVQSLPNWHNKFIMLIGDAAHAVSPNSGQGASMALEDAMLLARLLRDEKDIISAFGNFETLRKPRVEKIVKEGRRRGDDKVIVNTVQQFIRETMIRIFVSLFAEKGNAWLFEYKIDWEKK